MDEQGLTLDFNKVYPAFLTHMKNILNVKATLSIGKTTDKNPIAKGLQTYIKVYENTNPASHYPQIIKFYTEAKKDVLNPYLKDGVRNDRWLDEGSYSIVIDSSFDPKGIAKVRLSAIYHNALEIERVKREALSNMPEDFKSKVIELQYPDLFLLHLYRTLIFIVTDKAELLLIKQNVRAIEKQLGISIGQEVDSSVDPLQNMFSVMTGAFKKMGMEIPKDAQMPDSNTIMEKVVEAMNSDKVTDLFSKVAGDIQNQTSFDGVLSVVGNTIKEAGFFNGVEGSPVPDGSTEGKTVTPLPTTLEEDTMNFVKEVGDKLVGQLSSMMTPQAETDTPTNTP